MKREIIRRIFSEDTSKRMVITPLVDDRQIGDGVIDLRLGTRFIIFKTSRISDIDPLNEEIKINIRKYQEEMYIKFGRKIVLHPGEFLLGSSLEYLHFPPDVLGYVVGRSSWGRLGLIIETAPVVHPCFTGVLTFEFANVGTTPISIYPGARIAQITLHQTEGDVADCSKENLLRSRYSLSTMPKFSRIYEDYDLGAFKQENQDVI